MEWFDEIPTLPLEEAQDRIIREINAAGDVLSQYTYLIGLSPRLQEICAQDKASLEPVAKCQAQVWLETSMAEGCLSARADSDTVIVRSVLFLLMLLVNGRTPDELANLELRFLKETELASTFSDTRLTGFDELLRIIKEAAATEPAA